MLEELFISTLIYLGAAIILVPLVRKLGFSSVIGYILGGIIIGPFVLKLTGNADNVMHATEFGVVVLLFIVGLELEPKKFWAMRKVIVGLGVTQVLATTIILYYILLWAGWNTKVAITAALCFSMSSTAIVLQTLKERNLFNTTAGEGSFSILLLQDIAVIPILAFLPWLANPNAEQIDQSALLINMLPTWVKPFSIVIGSGMLVVLGRYIFVPFLRYVSSSGMNELLTATSLFLVVGVSELMILVGLSPALGAFIAGVMLANSEFRHELESDVDPFRGLLLAVFFVSVGSTINFNVILQDPFFIFTCVIAILAVKFGVLFTIGKIFKMNPDQNLIMSFSLSQVGEFAFVLISFASGIFLLDGVISSQLTAVVAITMFMTPILLLLHDKFISPKVSPKINDEFPEIPQSVCDSKVIIAGFGYFGSTVGRLLRNNGIHAVILDHDSDRVRSLRDAGLTIFYGDATRKEILEVAGADTADIIVVCLNNPQASNRIVQVVKKHFPHLKVFIRSKNRMDTYDFLNMGVENIYRETLGTALDMGVDILQATGMRKYTARRLANQFEVLDKINIRKFEKERSKVKSVFTVKEALEHDAELIRSDIMSVDPTLWNIEIEDTENKDE